MAVPIRVLFLAEGTLLWARSAIRGFVLVLVILVGVDPVFRWDVAPTSGLSGLRWTMTSGSLVLAATPPRPPRPFRDACFREAVVPRRPQGPPQAPGPASARNAGAQRAQ